MYSRVYAYSILGWFVIEWLLKGNFTRHYVYFDVVLLRTE